MGRSKRSNGFKIYRGKRKMKISIEIKDGCSRKERDYAGCGVEELKQMLLELQWEQRDVLLKLLDVVQVNEKSVT